jgi:hypothetical protein
VKDILFIAGMASNAAGVLMLNGGQYVGLILCFAAGVLVRMSVIREIKHNNDELSKLEEALQQIANMRPHAGAAGEMKKLAKEVLK